MKDLRYTWNRGTRDGLSLEICEPGKAPMDELKSSPMPGLQVRMCGKRASPGPFQR